MAAVPPPETALSSAADGSDDEDGDQCRICRFPAEADRPLRRPCACSGSIRFVHDDCLALSRSFAQVRHLLSLRLSATSFFADGFYRFRFMPSVDTIFACVSIRRAFVRDLGHFRQLNGLARIGADAVAPFALWVARLETHLQNRFGGLDSLQVLALHTVEASLMVVIVDIGIAFMFGFVPFTLGRIILWCVSCFNFGNVDDVNSYASTAYILLIGYGFIFSLGVTFGGMHTFHQYSRGERLLIAIFFKILADGTCWLLSPFRWLHRIHVMIRKTFSLCQMFFRGIANLITFANFSLNVINMIIVFPLLFGWSLDICTSKMFGATIHQRFKLLWASSFSSITLHWLTGCIFLILRSKLSSLLRPILRPGVSIPFFHLAEEHNVKPCMREPFYIISFKKLPRLFVGIINVGMVFLVPVQIAGGLAPKLFPLDIIYFDPPTKGTSFWQAPRTYAELLSGIVLLRFLICNTLKYLQPRKLVEKILRNWFATTGQALGLLDLLIVQPDGASGHEVSNSVAPNDQYGSTYEAMANRRSVAVRMTLLVVLAWLTVVILNTVVLIFPISVGRALLLAIPQLPVAGGLKSNDLFAFAVGFCTISTIIAASRDSFVYMTSGRTCILASVICKWGITALKSSPLLFIWIVIIPILIGLLVDFLLISPFKFLVDFLVMSPFIVPSDDIPVLDFFSIWFLGMLLLKFWTNLAHWTRDAPFLAHFIDGRWDWKLTRAKDDGFAGLRAKWVLQDILMPITMKLVIVLCVPYVLAKGLFPRFGYSAAVNSTVYHFAWLGSLALYALCYLAKVFWGVLVKLHDSIRDERYIIGQRLQDYTDNS
ncbi:unnamed protein product [Triticum turgidum subsp. durum]|uniref:RING-CH-type domain-containing protein n=1 Tax=Triticum turgidum subsp. durum TaxID=4567 RepID=A0A9R1BQ77_TRITD|nr:unnamed protein product [Triticum turgidum subsp. durum]